MCEKAVKMTEENKNMEIWDRVKQPPITALKKIGAGRLKGKSDINPQWRMQVMTDVYGPCGDKWWYEITKLWTEPGTEGQVFAFATVSLHVYSNAIPGIGGSMLIVKESSGLHCNDEAYKMAVTDALSVAMKVLGVAADIYLGKFDGSKYQVEQTESENEFITPEQVEVISKIIKDKNIDSVQFLNYMKVETADTILSKDFMKAMAVLQKAKGRVREPGEEG
jgi:hypothetical protein